MRLGQVNLGQDRQANFDLNLEHADWFHGPDGMGNMNYPVPKIKENNSDYKEVLNTLVNQYPNEITLVTLGPLTNLGQFILENPESYQKIKDIYIWVALQPQLEMSPQLQNIIFGVTPKQLI